VSAHNDKLRAARLATPSRWFHGRSMTRSELAHEVVEHVWRHDGVESPFDRKHIAKLETGAIRCPTARYRRALRAVLGARTDAELGFVSANGERAATRLDSGGSPPLDGEAAGLIGRLGEVAADAPAVMAVVIERAGELARLDQTLAAVRAGPADGPGGSAVRAELARAAASTEAAGRQVLAVLAELCQQAGLGAAATGQGPAASRYFMAGVRAAHAAGNDAFAAHLFSLLATRESTSEDDPPAPGVPTDDGPMADAIDDAVRWGMQVIGRARVSVAVPRPGRRTLTGRPRTIISVPWADLADADADADTGVGVGARHRVTWARDAST
jgi:hypothetical protein